MLLKRINIIFVLSFLLFFAGCVSSPPISSVTYPKERIGTKTYPDGSKYVGEFKNGKRNGQGALTWPDGRKYVGEFKDDKYIGHGTPSVTKAINVAKNYGQNDILKNKMMVSSQRWAVIIGLSNYKDTRIPPLRYASKDAKSFYDWAISPNGGKYPPSQVKLLMDNEATGRKIKDALYIWLKQALEEDVVAIYFAGHGSPESPDSPDNLYLLPYDTDYQNIASTGFPMWDIKTALKRFIKAKKVVVIADACHAGGVGQSFDVARRGNRAIAVNPISSGLQNLSQIGDGVCVISASDDKQFSQESKDWGGGHGVFTYFLLEGLKGNADYNKDKNVTLGELIPYLSEQVRRATRNAQSPTVAGRFDPALSVGR